jgi:hypothetical protein
MRARTEFARSNVACGSIILLAFLPVFLVTPSQAQKIAGPPKYDLHTEAKFKGTIAELKLPPKGKEKDIAHLLLKNGADTFDVYLCPKSFLDDMDMGFTQGEEIALTGSKVKEDGADLILAREVAKGSDTFVLRDAKGGPVWNWRH